MVSSCRAPPRLACPATRPRPVGRSRRRQGIVRTGSVADRRIRERDDGPYRALSSRSSRVAPSRAGVAGVFARRPRGVRGAVWISHRLQNGGAVIRIRSHAPGAAIPSRDLVVSADHGIRLAEGAPAESDLDTGNRRRFGNCPLSHDPATASGGEPCAEMVFAGDRLRRVRAALTLPAWPRGAVPPPPRTTRRCKRRRLRETISWDKDIPSHPVSTAASARASTRPRTCEQHF